jgi:hypothetical protein
LVRNGTPVYAPGYITNQVKSGHAPGFSIQDLNSRLRQVKKKRELSATFCCIIISGKFDNVTGYAGGALAKKQSSPSTAKQTKILVTVNFEFGDKPVIFLI